MPLPSVLERRKYRFTDDIKFTQKAVIFDQTGEKILALKRPDNAVNRPNCWDLPGGNVLYGQLHMESLLEEISEETSLEVKEIKPVLVETSYYPEKSLYVIFIGYKCTAKTSNVKLSKEHVDFKWVSLSEFLKLESGDFLQRLIKQVKTN